jgi:hypothetical protein
MAFDPEAFVSDFNPEAFLNDAPTPSDVTLINSAPAIKAAIPEAKPIVFDSIHQAVKHHTNATYVSSLLSLPTGSLTPEFYPSFAKQAGLSGNPEADFELIKNKRASGFVSKALEYNGKIIPGQSSTEGWEGLDELLASDRNNYTNTFLRSFITDGVRALDETVTSGLKKLSGKLADINPYLTQKQNELKSRIEGLNNRLDRKRVEGHWITPDDPDLIEIRQAKVQLDVINDTRKANQRQGLFYQYLEDSEAEIRAGRVFEREVTLATDKEFDKTLTATFISGMGSFAYSMSSFAIGGPIAGFAANTGAIYQGTIDDARAHGATEQEALDAGIVSLPAATLDAVIDKVLFVRLLKPLKGKMTVRELSKNIAAAITSGSLSEGAEQLWGNANAKYFTQYDKDRELDDGVLASMAMGAIFASSTASTSLVQLVPGFGKIRTVDPTPEEWDLIRKFETDADIVKNRGGPIALEAANGNPEARDLYHKLINGKELIDSDAPFGPLRPEADLSESEMAAIAGLDLDSLLAKPEDRPLANEEDMAILDLNEEPDLVAQDIQSREDEDSRDLLPAERKLVNVELEQELAALDEELAQQAPDLADENLSRTAKELAELELTETEGTAPQDLTKEQQEKLAAGLDVDLSPSTKIDKARCWIHGSHC